MENWEWVGDEDLQGRLVALEEDLERSGYSLEGAGPPGERTQAGKVRRHWNIAVLKEEGYEPLSGRDYSRVGSIVKKYFPEARRFQERHGEWQANFTLIG